MKNLTQQYKSTAINLYKAILKIKNKRHRNEEKYYLLLSEYQQTCAIHRQLINYCKARGIL